MLGREKRAWELGQTQTFNHVSWFRRNKHNSATSSLKKNTPSGVKEWGWAWFPSGAGYRFMQPITEHGVKLPSRFNLHSGWYFSAHFTDTSVIRSRCNEGERGELFTHQTFSPQTGAFSPFQIRTRRSHSDLHRNNRTLKAIRSNRPTDQPV